MTNTTAALTTQLEIEYCPPLDTATFLAILYDYDISRPEDLYAARLTLDALSGGADVEEATGFDPSGSSGRDLNGSSHAEADSESGRSQKGWSSNTDTTSLSQGMSTLDLEGLESPDTANGTDDEVDRRNAQLARMHNAHLESLDDASKEAVLIETFPGLKPFDIKWTLSKCNGNASVAIDELLNQVFLEGNGHRHQGIEAFSESQLPPRPKKGKGKKKRLAVIEDTDSTDSHVQFPSAVESKWETGSRDIEFLSTRTNMPPKQISFIYNKNNRSVPAAISAIIEGHKALQVNLEDATVAVNAQELSNEFPSVDFPSILALTQLTHPSTSAAHELAKALTTRPPQPRINSPIQFEFRLPPPDLGSQPHLAPKPHSHNAVFTTNDLPAPLQHPTTSTVAANNAEDYHDLRSRAFAQASAAHRLAKSNPLMGGASAYYSSLGHSYNASAHAATSAAADALVASQSSATTLDLHGVNVKDAVRIAREGVTAWWANARGGRGMEGGGSGGMHTGYKIVTGKGTHSVDGKAKLGPAVGRMLISEGWKVEVGSGILVVTGWARN